MGRGFLVFLIFLIFFSSFVSSGYVSISPASFSEYFEPEKEMTFEFKVSGPEEGMRIYLGGELRKYAEVSDDFFKGAGEFRVSIKLPKELDHPGTNVLYVGVIESDETLGEQGAGSVGGIAAIQAPIRVFVPYPGRYLEHKFNVKNLNEKENASYILNLNNLGTEDLNVSSKIEVFHLEDLDSRLLLEEINWSILKTKSSKNIEGLLNTEKFSPGDYIAYATIDYGRTVILNDSFKIGKRFIEILDYDYRFERGKINPFVISVGSKWNTLMEDVYAEIVITKEGGVLERIKTSSIRLNPWEKSNLTGFLDARNLSSGRHLANILVHYEDLTSNKLVAIYINDPPAEKSYVKEIVWMVSLSFFIGFVWLVYLLWRVGRLKRIIKRFKYGGKR